MNMPTAKTKLPELSPEMRAARDAAIESALILLHGREVVERGEWDALVNNGLAAYLASRGQHDILQLGE